MGRSVLFSPASKENDSWDWFILAFGDVVLRIRFLGGEMFSIDSSSFPPFIVIVPQRFIGLFPWTVAAVYCSAVELRLC